MAKITMDTSEYEEMKKVEKLLTDSLDREKELSKQINVLNQEKIKVLEEAKMKVVVVKRSEITEHILTRMHPDMLQTRLTNILTSKQREYRGVGRQSEYELNRETNYLLNALIESAFEKRTSTTVPEESITTKGLDEVKEELRKEAEENLSGIVQSQLETAKKNIAEFSSLHKERDELNEKLKTSHKVEEDLYNLLDAANKKIEELIKEEETKIVENKLDVIKDILKEHRGWFNNGNLLSRIEFILRNENN